MHYHQMTALLRSNLIGSNIERALTVRSKIAVSLPQIKQDIKKNEAFLFRDEYLQNRIAEESIKDLVGGWAETFAKKPEWMED